MRQGIKRREMVVKDGWDKGCWSGLSMRAKTRMCERSDDGFVCSMMSYLSSFFLVSVLYRNQV